MQEGAPALLRILHGIHHKFSTKKQYSHRRQPLTTLPLQEEVCLLLVIFLDPPKLLKICLKPKART